MSSRCPTFAIHGTRFRSCEHYAKRLAWRNLWRHPQAHLADDRGDGVLECAARVPDLGPVRHLRADDQQFTLQMPFTGPPAGAGPGIQGRSEDAPGRARMPKRSLRYATRWNSGLETITVRSSAFALISSEERSFRRAGISVSDPDYRGPNMSRRYRAWCPARQLFLDDRDAQEIT